MSASAKFYSQSKLGTWERCGEQYRRIYIEGERMAPGLAALRGTAVHEGARVNFRQKVESGVDLPEQEIVDAAADKFTAEAQGGEVSFTDEEVAVGIKRTIGLALDETVRYARAHAQLQAPEYRPVLVEDRLAIESGVPGIQLQGTLDLATADEVVDLKTKAKTPAERDVGVSPQLTLYAALYRAKFGRLPRRVVHDVLVGLKRGVERQRFVTTRGPADFNALAARLSNMHEAIQAGHFAPASPEHWCCSAKFCGFYSACRYVNPKRA